MKASPAAGLGLTLSRAPEIVRRQLALSRGAGLVVDVVAVGSPAAHAGFHRHDVLVMLDDQLLVLPEQFTVLLESNESGRPMQCTLLRSGRKVTISLLSASRSTGRPPEAATAIGLSPARPPEPAPQAPEPAPQASAADVTTASAELAAVDGHRGPPSPPVTSPGDSVSGEEILLREDPDATIRLARGERTRLLVADPGGRILFDDLIDEPSRRDRIPEAVRRRVDAMESVLGPREKPPAPRSVLGSLEIEPVQLR